MNAAQRRKARRAADNERKLWDGVFFICPASTLYEELSRQSDAGIRLFQGEVGVVDCGVRIIVPES